MRLPCERRWELLPRSRLSTGLRFGGLALTWLLLACHPSTSFSGTTALPPTPLARSAGPLSLGAQPVSVPLGGASLGSPMATPQTRRHLLLRGLTASAQPGVTYSVYIDLPPGATPAANDPRRVGTVNFYAARPPGAPVAADGPTPRETNDEKLFFSFDLTTAIASSSRRGLLLPQTTVTFIPDGRPEADARVVVGRLELVDQ